MRQGDAAARAILLVVCVGLGSWGGSIQAQNLLTNADFATSLDGWIQSPASSFVYDASQGSPAAGSALGTRAHVGLSNATPTANRIIPAACVVLEQCLPVAASRRYQFGVRCRPVPGQAATGSCFVQVGWEGSCGFSHSMGGAESSERSELGLWTQVGGAASPPGAGAATVSVYVCQSTPGPSYQASVDHAFFYELPAKGDFDDDGQADLVLHNDVSGENRIWLMNGVTRRNTEVVTPDAGALQIVASDDFDRDGKSDLVMRDPGWGDMEFWLMNGAVRDGIVPLTGADSPPPNWRLAASGDFNHDHRPDLLWRSNTTQELVLWTMNGGARVGRSNPSPDHAVDANWSVAAALDFDNDGNRDLLWYNSTSGKIVLWRMDANVVRLGGEFTSPPSAGDNNWQVLAGGDYGVGADGVYGSKDIVWRNATSGKFVVWHMDPDSVPMTRTSGEFTNPDGPNSTDPTNWTLVGPK